MATKLLLIEDVEDLGRSGDIVGVKPGYANNFLIPQKLAVIADERALRMQERLHEARKLKALADKQESEAIAAALHNIELTRIVKVDHDGHMYGSVSVSDIVHLLQEQNSITIEKRSVALKHAIKTTGEHEIHIKLKEGVTAAFKLTIVPEEVKGVAPPQVEDNKA
jgi:large subunit ribosomal protein L9